MRCLLKIFLIWSSGGSFVQWIGIILQYYEEQLCEIILNLDKWFRRICLLKISVFWSSGRPFSSEEWNQLCNFGRGYHEEQLCEFNLKFGPVVQEEMLFKEKVYGWTDEGGRLITMLILSLWHR